MGGGGWWGDIGCFWWAPEKLPETSSTSNKIAGVHGLHKDAWLSSGSVSGSPKNVRISLEFLLAGNVTFRIAPGKKNYPIIGIFLGNTKKWSKQAVILLHK